MPIYVFRHTDAGAPVLSGQVGSMIALLDALLLNGYNTKTVTLARSGSTVTATSTAHGYVRHQVVEISGANEAGYNGQHKVLTATANTFTFEIATEPATPATGTISCKVAAVGWTKDFSGTNLAAYRQPVGTCQFYLRVDDTAATSARVRGFEAMTGISAGTQPFPTTAQVADPGSYWWKSDATSSASRQWAAYSDGKCIHLFLSTYTGGFTSESSTTGWYFFGDFLSYASGDAYKCMLQSDYTRTSAGSNASSSSRTVAIGTNISSEFSRVVARQHLQSGGSIQVAAGSNAFLGDGNTATAFGSRGVRFPNPTNNALLSSPVFLCEQNTVVRGVIPGAIDPLHPRPFLLFQEAPAGAIHPSKDYICQFMNSSGTASNAGSVLIDVTGPWQ